MYIGGMDKGMAVQRRIALKYSVGKERAKDSLQLAVDAASKISSGIEIVLQAVEGGKLGDGEIEVGGRRLFFSVEPEETYDQWMLDAAILRAAEPGHMLFMCVGNSARSQMAEGIAQSLAVSSIKFSSAGSEPKDLRPEAVEVLREIGIDISGHYSKTVADIDQSSVDAVITLCAEEVCPAFFGDVLRAHWPLPDPAGVQGGAEARLQVFRDTRDELLKRLRYLLGA